MSKKKRTAAKTKKLSPSEESLARGFQLLQQSPLFGQMSGELITQDKKWLGADTAAIVDSHGYVYLNKDHFLSPQQWVYVIAHCKLHLAFGHFDAQNMPSYEKQLPDGTRQKVLSVQPFLWNEACDIFISRFLDDLKIGEPLYRPLESPFPGNLKTELQIYEYLLEYHPGHSEQLYGTAAASRCDMEGLSQPLVYDEQKGEFNRFAYHFAYLIADCASNAVAQAGNSRAAARPQTPAARAGRWFIDHYPLLGGLASHFKIVEDYRYCYDQEIQIAAIHAGRREIYINPSCRYSQKQWQFVLAHEYLHAGLQHWERCQGRDHYLWNVACDYVINGWLMEMQIGEMPDKDLFYDDALAGLSAETIYDIMVRDIRRYRKRGTFHGNGHGDILNPSEGGNKHGCFPNPLPDGRNPSPFPGGRRQMGVSLDDFCRNALQQGLEYHQQHQRGFLPAGLIEEIRALSMPAIPWDVQLAEWFQLHFAPLEKHRTYARPSRRQASTPDIPRPRCQPENLAEYSRTFGVVIDTSGSMSARQLGMALGSIASYAAARDVPYARVIFCDAAAYDAGYLSVEEIAGRVQMKGRGGTVLQPGIDLLENAKDFPKDGPILIITDGMIEDRLSVRHEHAFLLPQGWRLPFSAKSPVFYFPDCP